MIATVATACRGIASNLYTSPQHGERGGSRRYDGIMPGVLHPSARAFVRVSVHTLIFKFLVKCSSVGSCGYMGTPDPRNRNNADTFRRSRCGKTGGRE